MYYLMRRESRYVVFNLDILLCFTKQCEARIEKANLNQKPGPVNHPLWLNTENPGFEKSFFKFKWRKFPLKVFLMQYHASIRIPVIPNSGRLPLLGDVEWE